MKKTLLAFLFLVNVGLSYAQISMIDSLKLKLSLATNDTTRVFLMAELANEYSQPKPDSGLKYAEHALQLSRDIKYLLGEAKSLSSISAVYRERGDLPRAMNAVLQAKQIAEAEAYPEILASCYNRLAVIYFDLNEPKKFHYYSKMSYDRRNSFRNQVLIITQMTNYAVSFLGLNQIDSAIYYTKLAYEYSVKVNSPQGLASIFRVFGRIELRRGNNQLALDYFKRSIVKGDEQSDLRTVAIGYNEIGRIFLKSNQIDSCIYYAKKGLAIGQSGPFPLRILETSSVLAEAYKAKNDYKLAYEYQNLMIKTRESLFGGRNIEDIQKMISDDERRLKELEDERKVYQNKLKQYGLLTGLAVLSIVGFVLYRNNRQKQNANVVLQQQKDKVESTLHELKSTQSQLIQSEKMASLGELTAGIAHEIQNPLNFVNNFSEVSNELIDEMKTEFTKGDTEEGFAIADDIKQNLEKILHHGKRADAIVKGMLQHSRSSSGVKEPTDINALADEYLRLAYHGLRAKDKSFNATLKTDFDESIGNINIIPQDIGRVILNLITNAFYVVDEKARLGIDGYEPTVSVSTKKLDNKVSINIADNGNGIPQKVLDKIFQPFFTTKPTGQGTGLGLSLSYDIVKAHGGELKVETKEGDGSAFIIVLPVNP
jgi:two-component system, NtrC family, sensor kinase